MAAGGAVLATAALAAVLASPATAYANDRHSGESCSLETQEVKTWQEVRGDKVSQGTRDAAACADHVRRDHDYDYGNWVRRALDNDDWRLDD